MNLHTNNGGMLASTTFEHATFFRGACHLAGKFPHLLRGKNLHSLIPLFCVNAVPPDVLRSSEEPRLPHLFRRPFELFIEKTEERDPAPSDGLLGLGYPLSFGVPARGNQRWFLIEGAGFAAIHPQASFQFLCPVGRGQEWHLIFTSQVYELDFTSEERSDAFRRSVYLSFPDTAVDNPTNAINRFSIYGEEMTAPSPRRLPRFRADTIVPISRHRMDTTRLTELPSRFRVGGDDFTPGPDQTFQGPEM